MDRAASLTDPAAGVPPPPPLFPSFVLLQHLPQYPNVEEITKSLTPLNMAKVEPNQQLKYMLCA